MRSHPTINDMDEVSLVDLQQIAMTQGHHIDPCPNTVNQQVVYWLDNKRASLYTFNELKQLLLH